MMIKKELEEKRARDEQIDEQIKKIIDDVRNGRCRTLDVLSGKVR
jgi:hypothetical protein